LEATDFVQAGLLRSKADLECQRYALNQAITLAERELETRAAIAGLQAKAGILAAKSRELQAVRVDIGTALDRGDITIADATSLRDLASALEASRFAAQANAGRLSALTPGHVIARDSIAHLAAIEGELADIEARLRRARGWRLSTEAGVEAFARPVDAAVPANQREGIVPAVKIRASYKLGALDVESYDAQARAARQEAVYEDLLRPHQRLARVRNSARAYAGSSWRQYESIARALATKPKLFLVDEPAAGLNAAEVDTLLDRIRITRERGVTVVLVEHNMELVMNVADRVLVMDYGQHLFEGVPAEVQKNEAVLAAYLGGELM
jgi:ABC-type branched-subunit amino acid transport system ATPase component